MDFTTLVNNMINGEDSGEIQMYVNNSSIAHTPQEYACLSYLQGEFKAKMQGFLNPPMTMGS